eukprot:jgi/Tetstr1/426565/TSEL_001641.t1
MPPSDDTERPSPPPGAGLADSFRGDESGGETAGAMAGATVSMHPAARPAFRSDRVRTEQRGLSMEAATPDKLRFVDDELARFLASGGKTAITTVPSHSNGRSIYTRVETAYMHVDIYCYGWGAILDETTEARRF